MSGRKLSEVNSSLEKSAHLQIELENSKSKNEKTYSELKSYKINVTSFRDSFSQVENEWHRLVNAMGELKSAVSSKATGTSHYFDREYEQAEKLYTEFCTAVQSLRNFGTRLTSTLTTARQKHLDLQTAYAKELESLETELESREIFVLLKSDKGCTNAEEFAAKVGLGEGYLQEVRKLIAKAKTHAGKGDVEPAKHLIQEAWVIWSQQKNALKAVQDKCANDINLSRQIMEFFVKKGFDLTRSFDDGVLRMTATDEGEEYSATFRPVLDSSDGEPHVDWMTPDSCTNFSRDMNRHLGQRGVLHQFLPVNPKRIQDKRKLEAKNQIQRKAKP